MNKCGLDNQPDLDALLAAGFIEKIPNKNNELQKAEQDASVVLADCKQDAIPETEGEGEREYIPDSGKSGSPEYVSRKGRRLSGEVLDGFNQVWDAFDHKQGKAEAADAFLASIKFHGKPTFPLQTIIAAAKAEAVRRKSLKPDQTPIMLQGWLSKRRYEDYKPPQKSEPSTADWERAVVYANSTGSLPSDMVGRLDECPPHLRQDIERHLQ
jgi:hypothetical protein